MNDVIGSVLARKGSEVHTVGPNTSVLDAVVRMNAARIGALLVTDGDRPIGIFTERDVLVRVIAERRDPAMTPVGEVMTRAVITIPSDATVAEAMMVITDKRCRHLPVIDDGHVHGMVSAGDLTSWLVRDHERTIDDLFDYIRRP